MVKMIHKGNKKPGVLGEYKCTGKGKIDHGCGATLEIEESDLYQTAAKDLMGTTHYYITFECPACQTETTIPGKDYWGHVYDLPKKNPNPPKYDN